MIVIYECLNLGELKALYCNFYKIWVSESLNIKTFVSPDPVFNQGQYKLLILFSIFIIIIIIIIPYIILFYLNLN